MQKKIASFYIGIPCINNFGSCTYSNICEHWSDVCTKYLQPFGYPCNCPIPANTYTVPDIEVEVTKPLPSGANGEFRVTVDFLSQSVGQLGCLQILVTIA
jgi:ganglioside GM2 activator